MISIKGRQGYSRANFGVLPLNQDGDEIDMCTLNLIYVILSMSSYFHRLIAADCGVNVVYMVISTFVQSPWRVGWKTHGVSKKPTFIAIQRDLS